MQNMNSLLTTLTSNLKMHSYTAHIENAKDFPVLLQLFDAHCPGEGANLISRT